LGKRRLWEKYGHDSEYNFAMLIDPNYPTHVGAYVEQLQRTHAAPSIKQHLAAVRTLFDWLVMG
jgi:hypothetical protein